MAQTSLSPGAWLSGFSYPENPPRGASAGQFVPVGRIGGAWFDAAANPPVGSLHAASNPPVGSWRAAANPPVGGRHSTSGVIPGDPALANLPAGWIPGGPGIFSPGLAPGEWILTRNGPVLTEPPIPWIGVDPPWVWQGGAATLMSQALRKVRDRICPPLDPRLKPQGTTTTPAKVLASGPLDPLWRWEEPYRIAAVVSELMGRLSVTDTTIWWRQAPSRSPTAGDYPLFELSPPTPAYNYSDQIDKVLRASVEREDRMVEILTQANDIGVFFDAITGLDRGQMPRLRELVEVAWEVSTQLVMLLKNNIASWRPYQRSARIVPVIETPGHGSLPSGHATLSEVTARLLDELLYKGNPNPEMRNRSVYLERLARRIAFNRVAAGVHYPVDSFVGHALGGQLASTFISLATLQTLPTMCRLEVSDPQATLTEVYPLPPTPTASPSPREGTAPQNPSANAPGMGPLDAAPLWKLLWDAAKDEIQLHRM
jgi:hypothetical protein